MTNFCSNLNNPWDSAMCLWYCIYKMFKSTALITCYCLSCNIHMILLWFPRLILLDEYVGCYLNVSHYTTISPPAQSYPTCTTLSVSHQHHTIPLALHQQYPTYATLYHLHYTDCVPSTLHYTTCTVNYPTCTTL